jgi:hypothetical protein
LFDLKHFDLKPYFLLTLFCSHYFAHIILLDTLTYHGLIVICYLLLFVTAVRRIALSAILDTTSKLEGGSASQHQPSHNNHNHHNHFMSYEMLLGLAVQHSPLFPDLFAAKDRKQWDGHPELRGELIQKYHSQNHAWIVDFSYMDEDGDEVSFIDDQELWHAVQESLGRVVSVPVPVGGGNTPNSATSKPLFRCSVTLQPRDGGVESYLKGGPRNSTGGGGNTTLAGRGGNKAGDNNGISGGIGNAGIGTWTMEQQNAQLSHTVALQQEQLRLLTQTQQQTKRDNATALLLSAASAHAQKKRRSLPKPLPRSEQHRGASIGGNSGNSGVSGNSGASNMEGVVAEAAGVGAAGVGAAGGPQDPPLLGDTTSTSTTNTPNNSNPYLDGLPGNVKLAIQYAGVPPTALDGASVMELTKILAGSKYPDLYKYMHFVSFDNGAHEWCLLSPDYQFGKRTTKEIFQVWMCPDEEQRVSPIRFLKAHHFKYVEPPKKSVHHPDHVPAKPRSTKNDTPNVVKRFQELRPFMGLFEKEVRELGLWKVYPSTDEVASWYDQVHEYVYGPLHEYPIVPRNTTLTPSGKPKKTARRSYSQLRWSTVVSYLSDSFKKAGKPNWRVDVQNYNRQFEIHDEHETSDANVNANATAVAVAGGGSMGATVCDV